MFPDYENYTSYQEHEEEARAELKREQEAGYLAMNATRQQAEEQVGKIMPSKVAVLVKYRDGRKKVRLIHDLSRSGVNINVDLPERIVLPRICDVVQAMRELAVDCKEGEYVPLLVLDFSDAFKHLGGCTPTSAATSAATRRTAGTTT